MWPIITISLNPFVSQVGFFPETLAAKWVTVRESLNPFVSQVGFFERIEDTKVRLPEESQSLRKSGRFLQGKWD